MTPAATEWAAYGWPDLEGDPWRDWVDRAIKHILGVLGNQHPEDMYNWGDPNDDDWPIDGGDDDGHTIPIDGGSGLPGGDAGHGADSGPPPVPPTTLFKVIEPRIAGQVDVQAMLSSSGAVPGAEYHNVNVPSMCGTPQTGDIGQVMILADESEWFLPVRARPVNPTSTYSIGQATEGDGDTSTTWASDALPDGTDGLDWHLESGGPEYSHTGAQTLFGTKRRMDVDAFGAIYMVSDGTQNTVDTPEDCA